MYLMDESAARNISGQTLAGVMSTVPPKNPCRNLYLLSRIFRLYKRPEGEGMALRAVWLTFLCSTLHLM